MKKALLVAVGETEEPLIRYFNKKSGYSDIFLFHSKQTYSIAKDLEQILSKIFNKIDFVEIDPYDLNSILDNIRKIVRKGYTVEFNITGGTKLMTLAFFLASILLGAQCYYINRNDEFIHLPLITSNIFCERLTLRKVEILILLEKTDLSLDEIAKKLRVTKQTAEAHLSKLLRDDLIGKYKAKKTNLFHITNKGKIYLNILRLKKVRE